MKVRKIIAIVLTFVITVSLLCSSAFAAGEPTFRGEDVTVKAGDTIEYKVYIENNPGISAYKVSVDFSEEAFDSETQEMKENEFGGPIKVKKGDFSDEGNLQSNTTKYGCVAMWFTPNSATEDGVAFTVTMKIAENAINGTHAIKLRVDPLNTIDGDTKLVMFNVVNGSITVSGGVDGEINNDAVGPNQEELDAINESFKEYITAHPDRAGETINLDDYIDPNASADPDAPDNPTKDNPSGTSEPGTINENNTPDGTAPSGIGSIGGINSALLIAIIVVAVIAIAVVVLLVVKKKGRAVDPVITNIDEDRDLDINEVIGWQETDDDDDDDLDN